MESDQLSLHQQKGMFLSETGEMGRLIGRHHWNDAIGTVEKWPASLKIVLNTVLDSAFPMLLLWGTDLICLYNDAFRPLLGKDGKHPVILGKPAREAYAEIWPLIGPLLWKVLHHGETVYQENMLAPIYRNGKIEDAFWTFSYSPVRDENGAICGVLVVCTETTQNITRFKNIVESASGPIMIFRGEDLIVEVANKATLDLWQVDESVIGKSFLEVKPEFLDQVFPELLRNVLRTGEPFKANDYPAFFVREGGVQEVRYFNFEYVPYREANGDVTGITILANDVTEAVANRQRLGIAEDEVQVAVAAADLGYWNFNPGTGTFKCNEKTRELFGLPADEDVDLTLAINNIHPADRDGVTGAIRSALAFENNGRYSADYRVINPITARQHFVRATGQAYRNEDGEVVRLSGTAQDITEDKSLEAALRASEEKYRSLFENMDQGFCIIEVLFDTEGNGTDYRFIEYNEQFTLHSGLKDAVGKTMRELVPEIEDLWPRTYGEVVKTGLPAHLTQVSGVMQRWFDVSAYRLGEKGSHLVAVLFSDVTQRKQAEEAILAEKQLSQSIISASPNLTYIYDLEADRNAFASAQVTEILGFSEAEVQAMGSNFLPSRFHPDDMPVIQEHYNKVVSDPDNKVYDVEYRMQHKDGHWVWLHDHSRVFERNRDGKPTKTLGVATNVTERKKADAEIRKFYALAENSGEFIGMCDINGIPFYGNPAALALVGFDSLEDFKKALVSEFFFPEDQGTILNEFFPRVMHEGKGEIEVRFRHFKTGQPIWMLYNVFTIYDEKGAPAILATVSRNIHAQKEAQLERDRQRRLLETVTGNTQDLIYVFDLNYRFTYANAALLRMWGRSWEDAIGRGLRELGYEEWHAQMHEREIDEVLATRQPIRGTVTFPHAELGTRYYDYIFVPVINSVGDVEAVAGTTRDITDIKLAEAQVRQAAENYKATFDNAAVGIAQLTLDDRWLFVNDRLASMLGYTKEELVRKSFTDVSYPEEMAQDAKVMDQVRSGEIPVYSIEKRYLRKDGTVLWANLSVSVVRNQEGEPQHFVAIVEDISSRKQAELALRQSEQRLRHIIQSNIIGAFYWDLDTGITDVNDAFLNMLGYSREDIIETRNWLDLTPPGYEARDQDGVDQLLAKGYHEPFEKQYLHKNGTPVDVIVGSTAFEGTGNRKGITFVINISDRKKSEAALRESESRFRNIAADAPAFIFIGDENAEIEYINDTWIRFTGLPKEEALGQGWATITHPDDLQRSFDIYTHAFETRTPYQYEMRQRSANGNYHWILWRGIPRFLPSGAFLGILGFGFDITEIKRAEAALKESEAQLQQLSDFMPQMVWATRADGYHEFYNQRWYDFTGLSYEETKATGWSKVLHPGDYERTWKIWKHSLQTGELYQTEYRMRRYDGEYRWLLARATPFRNAQGQIVRWLGTCTDIHDQKIQERVLEDLVAQRTKELRRSNEDLQQFAHVASHDLKEPVRKIKTFSSLLKDEFGPALPEKGLLYLSKIEKGADRMYAMINGVLLYSSLEATHQTTERVDVGEVVRDIRSDLEVAIAQKEALIETGNLPVIEGVPILIYQLFYNLINNSLKFTKPAERPVIVLSGQPVDSSEAKALALDDQRRYVKIQVQDNGIGFAEAEAERIFQTFTRLNSKDQYEGTGLGLALCKKIAERHGGTIKAKGKEGEGAIFEIILPLNNHSYYTPTS